MVTIFVLHVNYEENTEFFWSAGFWCLHKAGRKIWSGYFKYQAVLYLRFISDLRVTCYYLSYACINHEYPQATTESQKNNLGLLNFVSGVYYFQKLRMQLFKFFFPPQKIFKYNAFVVNKCNPDRRF